MPHAPRSRRALLRSAGLAAAAFAGCVGGPGGDGGAGLRNGSFEDGLDGWAVGRDLPMDPNRPGERVAADATVTAERASDGSRSLALSIDGRQDDGTIWAEQAVDLGGAGTLTVDVYSPEESFNTITKVAAYAGPDPGRPLVEADFDTTRAVEDHAGWAAADYPVDGDGPGLVAVGISVVWETEVTRWLDAVRLG